MIFMLYKSVPLVDVVSERCMTVTMKDNIEGCLEMAMLYID